MSVNAKWFNEEHTIIYVEYAGYWTWQEWQPIHPKLIKMMTSVEHKVDYIVNMTDSSYAPPGVLYRLKEFVMNIPNNLGVVVFVGMTRFLKALVRAFWFLFPEAASKYPFEFADTVAEADAMLARHREEGA